MKNRRYYSIVNIIVSLLSQIVLLFCSFYTSRLIKFNLGFEYLGLNGIFSNIISFLSLTELGIGAAITFALYEPLAKNDLEKIKSIMLFYKKAYRIVALLICCLGIVLLPFICRIANSSLPNGEVIFIYSIFVFNAAISYLLVYKQNLIIADQKNFIVTIITTIINVVTKISQLIILYYTNNYILFLIISIFFTILRNVIISIIVDKEYPYLKDKQIEKLDKTTKDIIISKIKALSMHSIGTYFVLCTDNILVSFFYGAVITGKFVSYNMVITTITSLCTLIFTSIQASVGNYLAEEHDAHKIYKLFLKIDSLNSFISVFCNCCLYYFMDYLVIVWLGGDALISKKFLLALIISNFLKMSRNVSGTFRAGAGLFEPDRFAPIVESFINIVASIIFLKVFGPIGIVLGTITSYILVPFWTMPCIIYKKLFYQPFYKYFINISFDVIILSLLMYLFTFIEKIITAPNNFYELIILVIKIVPIILIIVFVVYLIKPGFRCFVSEYINKIIKNLIKRNGK